MLITPTTLVCLLFSTAIPTSLFIKQLFFILVMNGFEQKLVCSDSNLTSVVNYVVLIREEHCKNNN